MRVRARIVHVVLVVLLALTATGCLHAMMRRDVRRAQALYDGFPPRFDDPILSAHRERFLEDRRRYLDDPRAFFVTEPVHTCALPDELARRLHIPNSDEGAREVRFGALTGECPSLITRTRARILITYLRDEEDIGLARAIRVQEAEYDNGFIRGASVTYARLAPAAHSGDEFAALVMSYADQDSETLEAHSPSVTFSFTVGAEIDRNRTSVTLPLGGGRQQDVYYMGGRRMALVERRRGVRHGASIEFEHTSITGAVFPEVRECYENGERVERDPCSVVLRGPTMR